MLHRPTLEDAVRFFRSSFCTNSPIQAGEPRYIGLENEYLLVNPDGKMAQRDVLDYLWQELGRQGWQCVRDNGSSHILG